MIHGPHQELEALILNDGSDDFFEQIQDEYLTDEEAAQEINRRYPGFDNHTINGVIRAIKECE